MGNGRAESAKQPESQIIVLGFKVWSLRFRVCTQPLFVG